MEQKWLKKSSNKSEVFLIDFETIFGGFWEHFGGQNTITNRVGNLMFFGGQKIRPGAVCGDPRAAPGYVEARRHARRVPPGGGGKTEFVYILAPPNLQQPINWWLWALGLSAWQA